MERILQVAKNDFEEGGYAPDTLNDLQSVSAASLHSPPLATPWGVAIKDASPKITRTSRNSKKAKENGISL